MRIGDIIHKIAEIVDMVEQPSSDNITAMGNDKEPDDLFVPPLQQKMELLKKAVGVENIYDDGRPGDQGNENANVLTPEEEDALSNLMKRAGMQQRGPKVSTYNRDAAVMQELTNDEPLDD